MSAIKQEQNLLKVFGYQKVKLDIGVSLVYWQIFLIPVSMEVNMQYVDFDSHNS